LKTEDIIKKDLKIEEIIANWKTGTGTVKDLEIEKIRAEDSKNKNNRAINLKPANKRKDLKTTNIIQLETKDNQTVTFKNSNYLKHQNILLARTKKILYLNSYFGREDYYFGLGQKPFLQSCEVSNCYITNNRSLLGK
jgi:hypothetical protein